MSQLPPGFSTTPSRARPLHLLNAANYRAWREVQPDAVQHWLDAQNFKASPGNVVLLPDSTGLAAAVLGIGDDALDPFTYAHAPCKLPEGDWTPATHLETNTLAALQLGWGLGAYRFAHYRQNNARPPARLALDAFDAEALDVLSAISRVRDLVNTPADDLGPEHLEQVVRDIADRHGAQCASIVGDALLEHNFPSIHAVGRASHRAPRLIRMHWQQDDNASQHVVIIGKGVCFDTGGLDIKSAQGMRLMKKDMGGAAHAIALAELLMARRLPLRITLLIAAADNAIGPQAYRPGDIIQTRKGIQVEIDNTDAEGRIVLCDALTHAGELAADVILDFATLTGAARIALGPDLPALFSNDDALADGLLQAGHACHDPLWRMPLWQPYLRYLDSQTADIANAGSRMAGCITAALYLQRFVPDNTLWAHLDTYAWNDSNRPGRPQGGEALGLRAVFEYLKSGHTRQR